MMKTMTLTVTNRDDDDDDDDGNADLVANRSAAERGALKTAQQSFTLSTSQYFSMMSLALVIVRLF